MKEKIKQEEEIKQKLENDSLILANQLMAFVQNPPALKYMDEIRNNIQKTISKSKIESFNLGVTLSAKNATAYMKVEPNDQPSSSFGDYEYPEVHKKSILKLLIK